MYSDKTSPDDHHTTQCLIGSFRLLRIHQANFWMRKKHCGLSYYQLKLTKRQ